MGAAIVSLLFAGATIGCFFLLQALLRDLDRPFLLVVSIPAFLAWGFLLFGLAQELLGAEEIRLDVEGLHILEGTPPFSRRRSIPLGDVREIKPAPALTEGHGALQISTRVRPIVFGAMLPEEEIERLGGALRIRLEELQLRARTRNLDELEGLGFRLTEDLDRTEARFRGKWSLFTVCALLYVSLAWNGPLAALAFLFWARSQWLFLILLVPFLAVGLFFILMFGMSLFAPWIGTTWTFHRDGVDRQGVVLAFWGRRSFTSHEVRAAEVRKSPETCRRGSRLKVPGLRGEYSIALIGPEGETVASIDDLNEAEADVLAARLRERLPDWFGGKP